jgi:hypothetical protein
MNLMVNLDGKLGFGFCNNEIECCFCFEYSGAGSSDDFTFNPCLASLHTYLGGWRWRLETFCCSYFGFCFQCTLFELGNYHIACVWQRLKTLIIDWLFWMEVPF